MRAASRPSIPQIVAIAVLAAAMGGWFLLVHEPPGRRAGSGVGLQFLNTGPEARYVGVQVCRECHPTQHATYKQTPHSRAFRDVDPKEQPLPFDYTHEASGLDYSMYLKDGVLHIRESVVLEDEDQRVVLTDHPVRYVVGSGEQSLTYAAALDGFLVESPTTWYTAPKKWAMSPGYDEPAHMGFARPLERKCLQCHIGRAEPIRGSPGRLHIHEQAIGCERCHGPGSLHAERWRRGGDPERPDLTIVNPERLTRKQRMDLCSQCHLDDTLSLDVHGKRFADWRPSLPLEDYRIAYRLEAAVSQMSVVGHVDQLSLSRCFQDSETLTCITCHDPHDRPGPAERRAYFRRKCLTCHGVDACGLDSKHRASASPMDDCVECHMPRGDTDIVHFAFTDHRIAIGKDRARQRGPMDMTLVPRGDVSHLSKGEQDRHLGVAYLMLGMRRPEDFSRSRHTPQELEACKANALRLLRSAHEQGVRDPSALIAYAFLVQPEDRALSSRLAQAAAGSAETVEPETRTRILIMASSDLVDRRMYGQALTALEELVQLRRSASDWSLMAIAHRGMNQKNEALRALQKALEIAGCDPRVHSLAAEIGDWAGYPKRAAYHRRIGEQLMRNQKRGAR